MKEGLGERRLILLLLMMLSLPFVSPLLSLSLKKIAVWGRGCFISSSLLLMLFYGDCVWRTLYISLPLKKKKMKKITGGGPVSSSRCSCSHLSWRGNYASGALGATIQHSVFIKQLTNVYKYVLFIYQVSKMKKKKINFTI